MYAKSGSFVFMVKSCDVASVRVVGMTSSSTRSTPISLASSTNFLYAATARGGWKPYSTLTNSSFLPLTPPFSLMYCTASLRPWAMSLPWSEVGPVRSTRLPSLMIWACAAAVPRLSASGPSTMDRTSGRRIRLMTTSLSAFGEPRTTSPSVRVWPQLPVAPEPQPDARQALRLVHQEKDDGQAEDDVAGGGDQPEGVWIDAGQRRGAELEHLGQQGHEDRAVDGAEDAAHAPDDDHGQVVDGHEQAERVGEHDARVVGHEAPGHARVEGADDEREQLVAIEAHADDRGRHVAVAHRDERAAHPGAEEILREEHRRDHEGEDQVEDPRVGVEREAEHRRRRHVEPEHAVGHPLPVDDAVGGDEVRGERGDGEVEPLQAQRGHAEDEPEHGGHRGGERDGQPEREPRLGLEDGRAVRADGQEGGVPDGDLSRETDQDVEPDGADDRDPDAVQDVEPVRPRDERHEGERREQSHQRDDGHAGLEDALVGRVGHAEVAALHQTRSTSFLPNRP